jgi:hypothetical protein
MTDLPRVVEDSRGVRKTDTGRPGRGRRRTARSRTAGENRDFAEHDSKNQGHGHPREERERRSR